MNKDEWKKIRLVSSTTKTTEEMIALRKLAESRGWDELVKISSINENHSEINSKKAHLKSSSNKIEYPETTNCHNEFDNESILEDGITLLSNENKLFDCNVIFIHGMTGHPISTWANDDGINSSLPMWIDEDVQKCRVWVLGYPSNVLQLPGYNSNIDSIGSSILSTILRADLQEKPIIFIAHSMGGLVLKRLLLESHRKSDLEIKAISRNTKGVIFFATPHNGVPVSYVSKIIRIPFLSQSTTEMDPFNSRLTSTNDEFRELVENTDINGISFAEGRRTMLRNILSNSWFSRFVPAWVGITVVPESSARSGITKIKNHTLLSEDHLSICKLSRQDKKALNTYNEVRVFVESIYS